MPELLRAYGEALRHDGSSTGAVVFGLFLVTLALTGLITAGAIAGAMRRMLRAMRRRGKAR